MKGRLYIDGVDAYASFGVSVANGGYGGLAAFPPLKKVESNDWHEEDGVDVDLSNPALDTSEIAVKFISDGDADGFVATLANGAYHRLEFVEIGRTYRLRLVSQQSLKVAGGLREFTLQLANDFPLEGYAYAAPQSSMALPPTGYTIDDVDLAAYGVTALRGSLSEALKPPPVKKNLLRSASAAHGALYDNGAVTFQQKDVSLKCLMQAATMEELWRNRDALLYNLTKAGERALGVKEAGVYACYYKSCTVEKFAASGKLWLAFALNLVITSFRPVQTTSLLSTNAEILIVTNSAEFIQTGMSLRQT
jgi:hypothetical protein